TIIRNSNVYSPNDTWQSDEWTVLGLEDFSNLKSHTMDWFNYPTPEVPTDRSPDLYISEYFEGNGVYNNSKYIEIYNGLGYDVDLSIYGLSLYSNGQTSPSYTQKLTGILNNGETYIVYAPYSSEEISSIGNLASEV